MKRIYLITTAAVLAIMGALFILAPNQFTAGLGSTLTDRSLLHVMRSFGGFYLGFAAVLALAQGRKNYFDTAVISVVVVMLGFLIGRGASLLLDGAPDPKLWVSAAVELLLAAWGLFILQRSKSSPSRS
jgi:hypothetical protein